MLISAEVRVRRDLCSASERSVSTLTCLIGAACESTPRRVHLCGNRISESLFFPEGIDPIGKGNFRTVVASPSRWLPLELSAPEWR